MLGVERGRESLCLHRKLGIFLLPAPGFLALGWAWHQHLPPPPWE